MDEISKTVLLWAAISLSALGLTLLLLWVGQ